MSSPRTELASQLTSTSDQKIAFQFAFYNALVFVLTSICLAGVYAVYRIFYMFLTPIMWAVLVGTILFPLKRRITSAIGGWLTKLDNEDTPLVIGLFRLPFDTVNSLSDLLLDYATRREGVIVLVTYTILKVFGYGLFLYCISFVEYCFKWIDSFILLFAKKWILPLIILYFAAYAGWIYVQDKDTINKKLARVLSLPIWIYALAFVANFFGPLRSVVFAGASAALGLIAAGIISADEETESQESSGIQQKEAVTAQLKSDEANRSDTAGRIDKALTGDFYIQAIFGLCILLFATRHDIVIILVTVLLAYALIGNLAQKLGVQSGICSAWQVLSSKLDSFVHITVAGHLRKFVKLLFTSDKIMISNLHSSLDVLSSIVVMAILAFGLLFTTLFVVFQLHSEANHIIVLSSNVINSQSKWLSVARNYTEEELLSQYDVDNYIDEAYKKGRLWLSDNINSYIDSGKDPEHAKLIETQIINLFDNIYKLWEERDVETSANSDAVDTNGERNWLQQLKNIELGALKQELMDMVQKNMEVIINVAQSVWSIILANISLFSSFFISIAGVIVEFGSSIINFLIEMIVFLTAVYYLLASSGDEWLPVKWIGDLLPKSSPSSNRVNQQSVFDANQISKAIENSISGVFVLSAKMAIFYGLYTYFVHTLFNLNIVFVPSLLAAIFAAVPIMSPQMVCAIGVVELYLVRGEAIAAFLFFVMSFAPLAIVNEAFYRGLKTSHPYVTGLAIIGGIYWLGLQGAIIGPIILCLLLTAIHLYANFANF